MLIATLLVSIIVFVLLFTLLILIFSNLLGRKSTEFLVKGENVIKVGRANIWKGIEAVGGMLYLTDKGRLVHVPHSVNIQRSIVAVQVPNIIDVETRWTRFLGIPIAKNGLFVTQSQGQDFKYVVWGTKSWRESINSFRGSYEKRQ